MIDEQSSASGHDYTSDRSAIRAGWTLMGKLSVLTQLMPGGWTLMGKLPVLTQLMPGRWVDLNGEASSPNTVDAWAVGGP